MYKTDDSVWVYTGDGNYSRGSIVSISKSSDSTDPRKKVVVRFDAGWVGECWDTDCRTRDPFTTQGADQTA